MRLPRPLNDSTTASPACDIDQGKGKGDYPACQEIKSSEVVKNRTDFTLKPLSYVFRLSDLLSIITSKRRPNQTTRIEERVDHSYEQNHRFIKNKYVSGQTGFLNNHIPIRFYLVQFLTIRTFFCISCVIEMYLECFKWLFFGFTQFVCHFLMSKFRKLLPQSLVGLSICI